MMPLEEYPFGELEERLKVKAKEAKIPYLAHIELTYGCNLNCVHCYNPTHLARNELKTEELLSIIDQLEKLGTFKIHFTGGELFTRKDAFEILGYARQKGFEITIFTNATLITEGLAQKLKELEPYLVEVSVYGATEETYEKVTRVPGSFKKFVRGVELLKKNGIRSRLKSIILSLNVHEIEAMRSFCESLGVPFEYSTEVSPKVTGSKEPQQYRISPLEDFELWRRYVVKPSLDKGEIPKMAEESDPSCYLTKGPFNCGCGKSSLAITPYGKMNFCVPLYFPGLNVMQKGAADCWQGLVDWVEKTEPTRAYECPHCPVRNECTRGPADSHLEMGDVNACVPYFKEQADLRKTYLEELFKSRELARNP